MVMAVEDEGGLARMLTGTRASTAGAVISLLLPPPPHVYRQFHKRGLVEELRVNAIGNHILKLTVHDLHTGLDTLIGLRDVEASRISKHSAHEGCKFSAQRTGRIYPLGDIPGTHFC
jgi:hypothetical protein